MKPIKDQAAVLADSPSPYEAVVVLEPNEHGSRAILYQGNMETAERVMTCWNVQLGVDIRQVRRYRPFIIGDHK
jgi:hypothetical protein